jgi:hypothetical protein
LAGAVLAHEAWLAGPTIATAPIRAALIGGAVRGADTVSIDTLSVTGADAAEAAASIWSTDHTVARGRAHTLARAAVEPNIAETAGATAAIVSTARTGTVGDAFTGARDASHRAAGATGTSTPIGTTLLAFAAWGTTADPVDAGLRAWTDAAYPGAPIAPTLVGAALWRTGGVAISAATDQSIRAYATESAASVWTAALLFAVWNTDALSV